MSDYLWYVVGTAMLYLYSLVPLSYASDKSKKTKRFIIGLVVLVFSLGNGWIMSVNENKIPVEEVEKEWNRYVMFCKQEHISWSDITFPDWLSYGGVEWDIPEEYYRY